MSSPQWTERVYTSATMRNLANTVALAAGLCAFGAAHAQQLLVINQGTSDMSIVDPASMKIVATFAENTPGVHAHEVAVSADGKTAYLPIYGSTGVGKPGIDGHELLAVDIASRKVVGHLEFARGVRPHCPILIRAANKLYVTTELDKTVTIIDPKTLKIVGTIPTGAEESHMLTLTSDGRTGYTANVGPGSVSVLDMNARKTLAVIPVAPKVQRIAISRDNRWVFTSDVTQPRLAVIDTKTNKIARWVELPGEGYGAATTPDGKTLLIAIPTKHVVAVVDLASMKVVKTLDVPPAPQEVLVRPDGKVAYVSSNTSGKVSAIDLTQWKVTQTISTSAGADGLGWAE